MTKRTYLTKPAAMLIALALIATVFFAFPNAAKADGDVCEIVGGSLDGTQYPTVKAAAAALNGLDDWGRTILMLTDSTETETVVASIGVDIDLDGYTLTIGNGTGTAIDASWLTIGGGGALNVLGNVDSNFTIINGGVSATINGDVDGRIQAEDSATEVEVLGSLSYMSTGEIILVTAYDGATATVRGNVYGQASSGLMTGAYADVSGNITINGNLTLESGGNNIVGAWACYDSIINIGGNVSVSCGSGVGAKAEETGRITIDGTLTSDGVFIEVGDETKTAAQNDETSIKAGYKQYSDDPVVINSGGVGTLTNNYSSFVWLKIRQTPTYQLTVTASAGGTVGGTPSGNYEAGTPISVTALPNVGYHFVGWSLSMNNGQISFITNGIMDNPLEFDMPAQTVFAEAYFEPIPPRTFVITAGASSGGTITPSGSVLVNAGASQGFIMTPNTGYYILDVIVDGVSVGVMNTYTFTNVNKNHTIYVLFAREAIIVPPPIITPPPTTPQTGGDIDTLMGLIMITIASVIMLCVCSAELKRRVN